MVTPPNTGEDVEKLDCSLVRNAQPLWRSLAVKKKKTTTTKHVTTIQPTALLGIYPREIPTYVYTKSYIGMFTAALFIIPPN